MELANWKMWSLRKWRERNGYTDEAWISYRDALTIQDMIFVFIMSIISFLIGYYYT